MNNFSRTTIALIYFQPLLVRIQSKLIKIRLLTKTAFRCLSLLIRYCVLALKTLSLLLLTLTDVLLLSLALSLAKIRKRLALAN
jgi:hypothetical protein